jgi:hypothetical protein
MSRFAAWVWIVASLPGARAAEAPDYLKEIKPLLAARCYACHGGLQQKAKLRLDTVHNLRTGGSNGPAIVPGKSAESLLLKHIRGDADHAQMPPPAEGEHFSKAQTDTFARWIDAGAKGPETEAVDPDPRDHWAFRAPVRPPIPQSKAQNPIDAFLETQRTRSGLKVQPAADKRLLIRRVYLDVIGLPPTSEEIAAFVQDSSPTAYSTLIDKLLSSPQYGERWGRHFMDIWRYSDWWGLGAELRNSQRHIWHWRDWIIESLNADASYAEMLRDMLAADERHPTDLQKLRATGFLARPYFLFNRTTWLDEAIEHTSKAFLGLTFNCAKCHDHKYDPISQNDYYRLRAFFEPYQLRTDMLPGEADLTKNGLPRAFDCNLDAPTYKHERGDERRPLKDRPMQPGVPKLLEFEELKIAAIQLPPEAHAPHLRAHVIETLSTGFIKDREAQTVALADARRKLSLLDAKAPEEVALKAKLAVTLAEKKLAVANAQIVAVATRDRAERIKFALIPGDSKDAVRVAAKTEKAAALAAAEVNLVQAELDLANAMPAQKAAQEAKKKTAQAALDTAKKAAENPGEAYTPLRGAIKSAESNVEPAASKEKPFPRTSSGRRTALANWIADARNPLTARVLVNHLWTRHFNAPLVPTIFDFGRKGTRPTNPELLDWLAVEFVENKWSMKHLHKLILTSAAYQLSSSSVGAEANLKLDPENKLLWRQNPQRMQSQVVRDSLLHLAGQLDLQRGGPPVPLAGQEASRRRSIYFFSSHNEHSKFLGQFDDANVLDCYRRTESIVPQQALTLANSRLAISAAEGIAKKLQERHAKSSDDDFTAAAFGLLLGVVPTADEKAACRQALKDWQEILQIAKHPDAVSKARTNLVAALLNHNDFITVR